MKLYRELAEFYFDIESQHRKIEQDIDIIRSLLMRKESPTVLDLGCGTGEHLNRLKRYGVHCTGIDNSDAMLAVAKKRFPRDITFENSDLRSFDYYSRFDLVMSLFGSMDYLIEDDEVDSLFWNTWRAMKPDGYGLFELWNADPVRKIGNKPMSPVSQSKHGHSFISRHRGFSMIDSEERTVVKVNYHYEVQKKDSVEIYDDTHVMRAFTPREIEAFLNQNGFALKNIFANSAKEPYRENSNKMLIIFQKKL